MTNVPNTVPQAAAIRRKKQSATLLKMDRIEQIGAEPFARLGYHGVSLRHISEASGAQLDVMDLPGAAPVKGRQAVLGIYHSDQHRGAVRQGITHMLGFPHVWIGGAQAQPVTCACGSQWPS